MSRPPPTFATAAARAHSQHTSSRSSRDGELLSVNSPPLSLSGSSATTPRGDFSMSDVRCLPATIIAIFALFFAALGALAIGGFGGAAYLLASHWGREQTPPAWTEPAQTIALLAFCGSFVVLSALFALRARFHPIRSRNPVLVSSTALGTIAVVTLELYGRDRWSDLVVHWVTSLAYPLIVLPYFLRALRLHLLFPEHRSAALHNHQHQQLADDDAAALDMEVGGDAGAAGHQADGHYDAFEDPMTGARPVFHPLQRGVKARLRVWLCVLLVPFVALAAAGTFSLQSDGDQHTPEDDNKDIITHVFWTAFHVVECGLLFSARSLLRRSSVLLPFDISSEIAMALTVSCVYTLGLCAVLVTGAWKYADLEVALATAARAAALFGVSVAWPTLMTFFPRTSELLDFPRHEVISSLRLLLVDPDGLGFLIEFMQIAHMEAVARLWVETEMVKDAFIAAPMAEWKTKFFNLKRVSRDFNREALAVPGGQDLSEAIESVVHAAGTGSGGSDEASPEEALRIIQAKVYAWMKERCYIPFLRSQQCKAFLDDTSHREEQFASLVESRLI